MKKTSTSLTVFGVYLIGMGIVPLGEINRRFQDEQGRLNQAVAALSDQAVFMAAGLPLKLK